MKKMVVLVAAFGLLSACESTAPLQGGPAAAPGLDASRSTVDPLLVGHRLMAAREFELALKSYYRAAAETGLSAPVLASIGTANLGLSRLGQAERQLRQAIELDETYVPAWNNLGVVLLEQNQWGEAARILQTAFALDSGESAEIRENLRLALANMENASYSEPEKPAFDLVRRGSGDYMLLSTEQ